MLNHSSSTRRQIHYSSFKLPLRNLASFGTSSLIWNLLLGIGRQFTEFEELGWWERVGVADNRFKFSKKITRGECRLLDPRWNGLFLTISQKILLTYKLNPFGNRTRVLIITIRHPVRCEPFWLSHIQFGKASPLPSKFWRNSKFETLNQIYINWMAMCLNLEELDL